MTEIEVEVGPRAEYSDLERLLRAFLRSGASRNTAEARARDLGIPLDWVPGRDGQPGGRGNRLAWLPWCAARGLRVAHAEPHHVEQWLAELAATGYSNASRGRMLSSVSTLYRFLLRPDIRVATRNPAASEVIDRTAHHLNRSNTEPPTTRGLDLHQLRGLLEAAFLLSEHTPHGCRDRAMIEILAVTGAREHEVVGVDLDDYHRPHPGASATLRVHGKGEKDRLVLLPEPVADAVDEYLPVRHVPAIPALSGQVSAATRQPLFVTSRGRRVHASHVHRMLRRLCAAFSAERPAHQRWLRELRATQRGAALSRLLTPVATTIHPHQLRHAYATLADQRGVDARQVQHDLGHADLRTTLGYIDAARGVQDSAAQEVSPALHRGWWQRRDTAPGSTDSTLVEERSDSTGSTPGSP